MRAWYANIVFDYLPHPAAKKINLLGAGCGWFPPHWKICASAASEIMNHFLFQIKVNKEKWLTLARVRGED